MAVITVGTDKQYSTIPSALRQYKTATPFRWTPALTSTNGAQHGG